MSNEQDYNDSNKKTLVKESECTTQAEHRTEPKRKNNIAYLLEYRIKS